METTPTAVPAYAELHCLSNFTFLRGASQPEELVGRAHALGYAALALTDECSMAGVVRAHVAARACALPLIVGTELKLADGPRLVLLAPDPGAYGDLCALITRGRRRARKGHYLLQCADLAQAAASCLALWLPADTADDETHAAWVAACFGRRAWIAVELFYSGRDAGLLRRRETWASRHGLALVAAGDVHMHRRARRPLADALTAIRLQTTVAAAGLALAANAERHLRSRAQLACIYPRALLEQTLVIARQCHFTLDQLRYRYPREIVPPGETPSSHLRALTEAGMHRRWPDQVPAKVSALVERELKLIAELQYEAFFLTVYDIVAYARSQNILCQGRGSAANSAVCYCLGITEVDPATGEVLFERFISRERNEPPDIDVDFEHERREEVIQYVYRKYGRERAALAATVITYQARSAIRDIGKALALGADQIDGLTRRMSWWDDRQAIPTRLREAGFDPEQPVIRQLIALVGALIGFPRHLSQHVGGFVIADAPLERLVPIENAAMPERTVIQWDKDDLEALGLLKVDCLSLGMLTAIHRTFDLIAGSGGPQLSIADIKPDDPATYEMIQHADTVGVFQIESRAQMAMLPRLRPKKYYDLVIQVAIVRPGPIQGDMVHPYLRRRNEEERADYPSDEVEHVLQRTLGVPLFQEQVMQLAVVAAGFTPGEADQLRRSMAAWKRSGGMGHLRDRLINGMRERGYQEAFAQRIFRQIEGFGEYGFPESHAASFALLAYVSAWLKCHTPAAFTAALLNSQPMGFYGPAQLVQDARRHGVEVRPPDVRYSDWDCSLESAALRLGLRMIKGLPQAGAQRIVAARRAQAFVDVVDLCQRAAVQRSDVRLLAAAGALAGLAGHRYRAGWDALGVEAPLPVLPGARIAEGIPLLRRPTEGEDIVADYVRMGLTLGRHPLALLRKDLAGLRFRTAAQILATPHGRRLRTAGLVITRQRPGTASGVVFVTLEDETGVINLIVWASVAEAQRQALLHAHLLGVAGEVQREGEVVHVIAHRLEDHTPLLGSLRVGSRDFR